MTDAEGVTDPEPQPSRGRFRPLDTLANTGVAAAYQTVFLTLRRLVEGRRVAVHVDESLLTLTITRLRSRLDLRGLSIAQLNDIRVVARDLRWRGHRVEHASVVLRNVRIRPSVPPVLVAAPVELTVEVPAPALDDLLRWAAPRLSGDVGQDGVARLHLAKRRGSGHVEVEASLDGATLVVRPRAVVRRRRWALPARTPSYRVRLPDLPRGLELTSIEFAPGLVRLTGVLPEWQMDVPRTLLAPTDRHR
jgi:hypothetical protein